MTARLIVSNTIFAAALVYAWIAGYVQFIYSHDISRLSYGITALFIAAMVGIFIGRRAHLERVETWLVTLGLIGNVIGFVIALQTIDVNGLGTADGVRKVTANLLDGMGVAFCSTLVGAVCALWLSFTAWLVEGGE